MQLKNYNVYFFLAILLGITVLAYFMLKPFFILFILAVILAHSFSFIYKFWLRLTSNRKGISSALTCLIVALIIIVPISFIVYAVVNEVQGMVNSFTNNPEIIKNNINNFLKTIIAVPFLKNLEIGRLINPETVSSIIKSFSQNILFLLQGIYSGTAYLIFAIFIIFFSLFYLFIDGQAWIKRLMRLSPLKDSYEDSLIKKFNSITRGIIRGTFAIAAIQGALGAMLFWLAGVASPVLLGILMAIASVIPSFGTGLVWLPVGIIMILMGNVFSGIIILVVGIILIGSVDNILSPRLIGKDTQMHPLLILFSTLGGIFVFGAAGFIIGPIVMSLFVVLWEIYSLEFKGQLEEYNQ